jgi:transcription elongation factor GreA
MDDLDLELSGSLYLTREGMDRLKAELTHLTVEKRREIAERIRESKDHGEFSEDNSELDEVKVEQAIVENRINDLKTILSGATVLSPEDIPVDRVGLGSVARVSDEDRDIEFSVRIVASIEANAELDLISEESPLGNALLGKKVGEAARFEAPAGTICYKVLGISR